MQKSTRLNQELIFLSDKKQFNLRDLMDEFQISKRTALRDLAALEELGMAFYSNPGRSGGYQLMQTKLLTPIYFSQEEITAIFFALKAMTILSETPFSKSFSQIRDKLLKNLSANTKEQVEKTQEVVVFYNVPTVSHSENLDKLLQAALLDQVVEVEYHDKKVQLQLYQLFYRDGYWFCSGLDLLQHSWWNYRTDEINNFKVQNLLKAPYTRVELKKFAETGDKIARGNRFSVDLTPKGKAHFLRNPYPNMQLLETDKQLQLIGTYNQAVFDFLVDYLITFSVEISNIKPDALRQAYLKRIMAMLNKNI